MVNRWHESYTAFMWWKANICISSKTRDMHCCGSTSACEREYSHTSVCFNILRYLFTYRCPSSLSSTLYLLLATFSLIFAREITGILTSVYNWLYQFFSCQTDLIVIRLLLPKYWWWEPAFIIIFIYFFWVVWNMYSLAEEIYNCSQIVCNLKIIQIQSCMHQSKHKGTILHTSGWHFLQNLPCQLNNESVMYKGIIQENQSKRTQDATRCRSSPNEWGYV